MNITPTQFKELLLEEVGNCTEPQHVIFSIVKDMEPNDVAELFQDVFEQLPGVDMTRVDPEAEEEPIPTSYQPGGELGDRPVVGFKEQLMEMVRQELREITYMDRLKRGDISAHGRNVAASQRRALMDVFKDFGGSVGPEAGRIRYITFTDRATAMKAYEALKDRVGQKGLSLNIPHVQPKTGYQLRLEGP